jgi:hypothetical protein
MVVNRSPPTRGIWRSKSAVAAAALYLLVSIAIYFHAIVICTDGFFCGLETIPAAVPFGLLFAPLLSGYVPSPAILQWAVMLPTVLCNAALYYLLGVLVTRMRQKKGAAPQNEPGDP